MARKPSMDGAEAPGPLSSSQTGGGIAFSLPSRQRVLRGASYLGLMLAHGIRQGYG